MKILVADDERVSCLLLQHTLTDLGYEVVVARNGAQAWDALQGDLAPRMAILDWVMPEIDGIELCRRLRARTDAPYVFVVLVTAKNRKEDALAGFEAGADDFLSKPIDLLELGARLRAGRRILELNEALAKETSERRRSEARYRGVSETAREGIVSADREGRIAGWNQGAVAMFGYLEHEAMGQPLTMLMPEKRRAAHVAGFARFAATGQARVLGRAMELEALRKDGSEFPCELSLNAWQTDEGRFFTGIFRDITERRHTEEEVRRLASIVECSDDGIYGYDFDGRIQSWNRGAERLYGYTAVEVMNQHLGILLPADNQREAENIIRRTLGGERVDHQEIQQRRKDGTLFEVFLTTSLLRDVVGATSGVAVIVRDITQKKNVEKKLILADRMASVGTLAAGVAHEINNPLCYVTGNLELLLEAVRSMAGLSPDQERDVEELINDARDGAERVRKIVRDLKMFSRCDEERRGPVELVRVLDFSANMAFNEIRHRARLVKDYQRVPPVQADESRLAQVFINLLVNAAHAIVEGSAERNEIRLSTFTDAAGRVVAEVRDTGHGIPAALTKRIFDPFFTTKEVGLGTGLGLSICHGIITDLGGEISVESEAGKGSLFRVTLPPASVASPAPQPAAATLHGPSKRGRVLVVDDEPILAATIQRILRAEHDIVVVHDGQAAIDRITSGEHFDLVLSDLMMPMITGMDLHAELSKCAPEQAERMIFITGGAFTPRARQFLDTVRNQWIEKPFNAQNLKAIVRGAVR